ncbi:MAG: aldo/keto reductase [Gammaproteobacteria bacterium]
MLFGTIRGSDKKVARLICGGDRSFGLDTRMLDHAFERGINAFDTARVYGPSEGILGRWLKTRRREDVFIVSKGGFPRRIGHRLNRKEITRDLDMSLMELGTDFIDAYFFHYDAIKVPPEAIVELAAELVASGKVGVVGYSNFTPARLQQIQKVAARAKSPGLSLVSAQMSLPVSREIMWPWPGSVSISGPAERATRQWISQHDLAVVAYSCLGRGFFTKAFWDQVEHSRSHPVPPLPESSWLRKKLRVVLAEKEPIDEHWLLRKYDSPGNREIYRRALELAGSKGVSAAQIGLAYLFHKNLNLFAVVGWSNDARCDENAAAMDIVLSDGEIAWLEGE